MPEYRTISAEELKSFQNTADILIVDIRELDEFNREHMPNALHAPLSRINKEKQVHAKPGQTVVFHCQAGTRTCQAKEQLASLGLDTIYILDGGINAWKKSGGQTICNSKAPIPLMRQVQMIVGFMVLLGIALAHFISPFFIWISAFFGAGLLFAGITGFCGLAKVLLLFPYNKNSKGTS